MERHLERPDQHRDDDEGAEVSARDRALADLWLAAPGDPRTFRPEGLPPLPDAARRYLEHAVAPGTRMASAVRLKMHGRIKLGDWLPFTADQVIHRDRGMVWSATALRNGLPLRGTDRFLDGRSFQAWKLLGLLPVMRTSDRVPRAHAARVQAESVWLPSLLCEPGVAWSEPAPGILAARIALHGKPADLALAVDEIGRVQAAQVPRRESSDGVGFRNASFGGLFDQEATFGGYTIPTRVRLGQHFGDPRFEADGEFLRAVIDHALFR